MAIIQPTAEQQAAAANPTPLNVGIPGDGVYITDPQGQTLLIKTGNTLYQTGTQDLGMRYAKTLGDAEFQKANGSGAYAMELGNKYLQSLGLNYSSLSSIGGSAVADLLGNASKLGLTFSNNLDLTNLPNLLKTQQTSGSTATLNTQPALPASPEAIAAAKAEQTKQLSGYQDMNVVQSTTPEGIPGVTKTPLGTPTTATATPTTPLTPGTTPTTPTGTEPNDITQLLTLPDLQEGSQGQEVLTLQNWLVAHGFLSATDLSTGPGIYGPRTKAAVAAWQQANGIDTQGNPGYFGPISKAFLQQQVQSGAQTVTPGVGIQQGSQTGTPSTSTQSPSSGMGTTGLDTGMSDLTTLSNEIRKLYGLPESSPGKTITQQAIDDYKEIYTQLGIPTVKDAYNEAVKEFSDIQNELKDKIADINEDPWLSESVRVSRINKMQDRYEGKLSTATSKMNLYKSLVDQGIAEANDIMGRIHQVESTTEAAVNQAIDIVQKQIDAKAALAKESAKQDTQVVEIGGRKVLIDSNTGRTIKDLGVASSGTSAPRGSVTSGSLIYTPEAQSADSQVLEQSRGNDGWVDPNIYLALYNAWLKKGGTVADFLKQYPSKLYVNPANDWLPPILQNTNKSLSDEIDSLF